MKCDKMFMASYKGVSFCCHVSYSAIKTVIARESMDSNTDLLDYSISEVFVVTKEELIASGNFDKEQILNAKFDRNK